MTEIVVNFTEAEARALLPWRGSDHDAADWNRRANNAEDAQHKIKTALREQAEVPVSEGQEQLGGLAA